MENAQKRGWVVDQIMLVGQLEAAMGHNDERLNDLQQQLENGVEEDMATKITDELSSLYEMQRELYDLRVEAQEGIFAAFPVVDHTKWCLVKHLACAFIIASENFHARGCSAESEQVMLKSASALGKAVSMALGFEPYGCLRCLGEAIAGVSNETEANI